MPSDEELILAAKAYADKKYIRSKNILLYDRIIRKGISKAAFSHMPDRSKWSEEISGGWTMGALQSEIIKYVFLCDFRNDSPNAYAAVIRKGLKHLISNLKSGQHIRSNEELRRDALLYKSRKEFKTKMPLSYSVALRRGSIFFDDICSHMKRPKVSIAEATILKEIVKHFPVAKKVLFTRLDIEERPYIKSLEVDIFVPGLNLGIEYDGKWYHSREGLIRSHPTWPEKEAVRYHEIKDEYFISKGIKILHIKEEEWNLDKRSCIKRCLKFLGVK